MIATTDQAEQYPPAKATSAPPSPLTSNTSRTPPAASPRWGYSAQREFIRICRPPLWAALIDPCSS